jgi:hypothetical protein
VVSSVCPGAKLSVELRAKLSVFATVSGDSSQREREMGINASIGGEDRECWPAHLRRAVSSS